MTETRTPSNSLRDRATLFVNEEGDDDNDEEQQQLHENSIQKNGIEGSNSEEEGAATSNKGSMTRPRSEVNGDDDDGNEDERDPKRRHYGSYLIPNVGESYMDYVDPEVDVDLLKRGEVTFLNFQRSIHGQLDEVVYELIRTKSLTEETLAANFPHFHAPTRCALFKRRYVADNEGRVRDQLRGNRIVCDPVLLYEMMMTCHLMNDHAQYRRCHVALSSIYANITRDFLYKAVQFCSVCNPSKLVGPLLKFKHVNYYKGMLPLERVHIEIFEPFNGKKIEGKYSHVIYCRDYRSRYIMLEPLKNTKFKNLVSAIAKLLFNLPRIPIFIETVSLNTQDAFDIFEAIVEKYQINVGLGMKTAKRFHTRGVKQMKILLEGHRKECLNDWTMCLKYGPHNYNTKHNDRACGVPVDLLTCNVKDVTHKSIEKYEQIIRTLPKDNIVQIGNGSIYLEEKVKDPNIDNYDAMLGEEYDSEQEDNNNKNTDQDLAYEHPDYEYDEEQLKRRPVYGISSSTDKEKESESIMNDNHVEENIEEEEEDQIQIDSNPEDNADSNNNDDAEEEKDEKETEQKYLDKRDKSNDISYDVSRDESGEIQGPSTSYYNERVENDSLAVVGDDDDNIKYSVEL
ncbi:replication fork barrier binding protein FOB1 NDAI_0J01380 [Naumovozyma dairenensis CBS 421]|uniref:Uncharacterized protein n=1 Tax=Naumovozyma dairenensis (strain ATCC 10597 / BCRC 20456 / CBS 421 / NBRC 0211 / NRRL Y-12639) TaxID=1071378 RepID=G0WGV2_NAUDC|nr:hypothetical protein NDAI_0J01380 [Naumovozyma dairenensis CBS 421]CCD27030.1 hypothetical protein NDAI_0J01380 [Naumovozyma dairenensis CBS 421]